MTPLLEPAEGLALVGDGLDDAAVGPVAGRPLLAIRLSSDAIDPTHPTGRAVARLAEVLRSTPVVLVGVLDGAAPTAGPGPAHALDVLVCADPTPARPWVGCPDGVDDELSRLAAAAEASPVAAAAMAQLLRTGEGSSAADAVVAESWVYGLLQAGAAHRRWLAARADRRRRARPDGPVVAVERHDEVLVITLDRPEVRNAYGARMRDELVAAVQVARLDPTVARVELRGAGPAFCSGGDLDEFGTATDVADAHVVRTTRNAGIQLSAIAHRVTAHVHGACVGAGVELPAFVAAVVARSDATFRLPEVAMGLVPGAGGTASIPRRIGRHRTAHLALRGDPIDAATAQRWGLVDRVDDTAFSEPPPGAATS